MSETKPLKRERKPVDRKTSIELLGSAVWYLRSAGIAARLLNTANGLVIVVPNVVLDEATHELNAVPLAVPVVANAPVATTGNPTEAT